MGSITLLQRQINVLNNAGISEIGIVTGYQSEKLQKFCLKEFHNSRWQETNMVSSLMKAKEWLQKSTCIVAYSDIFYDVEAIKLLVNSNHELAITYDPYWLNHWKLRYPNPLDDAESFSHSKGKLINIGERAKNLADVKGQYMGLIKISPKSWFYISTYLQNFEEHIIDRLQLTHLLNILVVEKIVEIGVIPYTGIWGEIDNQKDLSIYEGLYFSNI